MVFYPDTTHLITAEQLPHGVNEVFIQTEDNVKIQCLYLPVARAERVLIYFHGNAGNIYHRLPDLIQLSRFGVSVLGVSYRGYGRSDGRPSEEGIYRDGKAALDYVTQALGYTTRQVILFGRSIGTTVAVDIAQDKDMAGVILVTPLTSGAAMAKVIGFNSAASLAGDAFNNLAKIKHLQAPLLVIHGTQDTIVPYAMGKELYEQAPGDKRFIAIEGANHNDLQDTYRQHYWPPIQEFLQQHSG